MRSLPINPPALWALEKFFLLVKDEIRNLPFHLFPWDFIEESIAEEAPGEEVLLIQSDVALLNKLPELQKRFVLRHPEDSVL
jgi:hypothetical protein